MSDIFTHVYTEPVPWSSQDDLRLAMADQYKRDLATIKAQGRRAPWIEEPDELRKDYARALTAIADACGLQWSDRNAIICQSTANAIGMTAIGNAKAVLKDMQRAGLITWKFYEGIGIIALSDKGRDALEEFEEW